MRFKVGEVAAATGGEVAGDPASEVGSYHTDSRSVAPGGLFFALRGAEMDGHEFVQDAAARGAVAAVVERRLQAGLAQVVVSDTWRALFDLAGRALASVAPLAVGVTGSNGKTTTKELLAAALGARYTVLKTEGNLNTETGVPLTLLRLEPGVHTALVAEMGMQGPGEIARLAALVRPTIGVITVIGSVHLEFFEDREGLARAKGELVEALPAGGTAVLNADGPFLPLLESLTRARVLTFGSERGMYRVEGYRPLTAGAEFSVRGQGVRLRLMGQHHARNAAAALAAAEAAGVPMADAAPRLAEVEAVPGRMRELTTPAGVLLLDDSYNASPESMVAAFAVASERPARRRLAILGEMRELGSVAETEHERVGRLAAEAFDLLAVIAGGHGDRLAAAAGAEALRDLEEAERWVRARAKAGDLLLVKGSRGVHLERLVERLLQS
jgi:UDP-N-acetylmuramoyl-tripeptide--D-alanyl-D-alanine ligase